MSIDYQALALRARRGDVDARDVLFAALATEARGRAERFASIYGVDAHDVESEMAMTVQRCLESYNEADPNHTPFSAYVRTSWRKAMQSVLTRTYDSARGRNENRDEYDFSRVPDGVSVEDHVVAQLTVDLVKRRLREEDDGDTLVTVLMLRLQGASHEEIARECGFAGTREAAKMWTTRAMQRMQRALYVPGDAVRVRSGRRKGATGVVVGRCVGDARFTHVVALDGGRELAFDASEIEWA